MSTHTVVQSDEETKSKWQKSVARPAWRKDAQNQNSQTDKKRKPINPTAIIA
jgi:hypothetical protein